MLSSTLGEISSSHFGRLLECALFVAGLAFGSFLNVCISRIPRHQSIVAPPSHCSCCNTPIAWYDNVPLGSWLLLRGRCRHCPAPISLRYPAVELLTAILFTACYFWFGLTWLTVKFCVLGFLLIGLIFMDAETGLLPREFTHPGIVLGFLFSWIAPGDYEGTAFLLRLYGRHVPSLQLLSLFDAGLGAIVGGGFLYLAWALYYLARRKHGLGFGDIALIAMSGAFLGLKLTLLVIFCAPILAVLYVVVVLVREAFGSSSHAQVEPFRGQPFLNREIPFGVFLGLSALTAIFLGQTVWSWYLGMF